MRLEDIKLGQIVGFCEETRYYSGQVKLAKVVRITDKGQVVVKAADNETKRFYPPYYTHLLDYDRAAERLFNYEVSQVRDKLRYALHITLDQADVLSRRRKLDTATYLSLIAHITSVITRVPVK